MPNWIQEKRSFFNVLTTFETDLQKAYQEGKTLYQYLSILARNMTQRGNIIEEISMALALEELWVISLHF